MAGDLEFVFSASDENVARVLQRIERMSAASGQRVSQQMSRLQRTLVGGFGAEFISRAARGAITFAGEALSAYAERSAEARREVEGIEASWTRMKGNIGQDIFGGVGSSGGIASWIDDLETARMWLVDNAKWLSPIGASVAAVDVYENLVTVGGTGTAAEKADAFAQQRAADLRAGILRRAYEQEEKTRADELAAADDMVGAETIRANMDYKAAMAAISERATKAIAGGGGTPGSNEFEPERQAAAAARDQRIAAARAKQDKRDTEERLRAEKEENSIIEARYKREMELEEEAYQATLRFKTAHRDLRFENDELDITLARARGEESVAKKMEITLEYARRIAEAENNSLLSWEEKAALVDKLGTARDAEIAGITKTSTERLESRSIEAGVGGSTLSRMVFGGNGGGGQAATALSEAKEQSKILRQIRDKVGGPAAFSK